MLEDFPRLFIEGYDQITGVTVVQHHIKLKEGSKPTVQRLRRLGVIQQDALLVEVRKLLNAGFIYPVEDSEWVSQVVVTPKKNGKWRVCVDYKPLNAATKRDHFPLPFQDEILNEVAGYERYTVCDGYSGYFQIRIAEEDQKKTTFVTPWGCFAYRVMPFGLTNAPATFQRFVTHVFQPFFGKSIRVFIDDFCIYSSRALHIEKVHEGLSRLQSMGGQLNIDKCHIGEAQVTLLGHVVSARGIEADPGTMMKIVSRSVKQPKLNTPSSIEARMVNAMRERGAAGKSSIKAFNSIIMKFPKIDACFEKVRVTFRKFDKDGSGTIDLEELKECFRQLRVTFTDEEVKHFIKRATWIQAREWTSRSSLLYWLLSTSSENPVWGPRIGLPELEAPFDTIVDAYLFFDKDGDGYVSKAEIIAATSEFSGKRSNDQIGIKRFGLGDGLGQNGLITFKEFLFAFTNWVGVKDDDEDEDE
ncbi:hypothetical protein L7F22_012201 [Adiantum nelumboides]|nr:hypothetical protein [Adiantum nelumboides]